METNVDSELDRVRTQKRREQASPFDPCGFPSCHLFLRHEQNSLFPAAYRAELWGQITFSSPTLLLVNTMVESSFIVAMVVG